MKKQHVLFVLLVISSLLIAPAQIGAQDAVTCDATLTTLLAVAVWDYGYQPSVDLSAFDFGQYTDVMQAAQASLSEASAALDEAASSMEQAEAQAQDALQDAADAAGQVGVPGVGDALQGAQDAVNAAQDAAEAGLAAGSAALESAASSIQLASGAIQGENASCSTLRAELESFFAAQFAEKLAKEQ